MVSTGRGNALGSRLPDRLELVLLRASRAPAHLSALDVTRAASLPGVVVVLAPQDPDVGRVLVPEVRFPGQVLAAIAAETREAGERACAALVPAFDEPASGLPSPPPREPLAVHAHPDQGAAAPWAGTKPADSLSYTCAARPLWTPLPPEILVTHEAPGRWLVQAATAAPFALRRALAGALGLPVPALHVRVPSLAPGGPSGLTPALVQGAALAVLAARRSGRALRLGFSRAEELAGFAVRAERRIALHTLIEAGRPRALHVQLDADIGAADEASAVASARRAWSWAEQLARERLPGLPVQVSGNLWASARPPALFDEAAASEAVAFALASWERDLRATRRRSRLPAPVHESARSLEANELETIAFQRLEPRPTPARQDGQRHLRRGLAAAFGCWPGQPPSPVRSAALELLEDGSLRARLGRPDIDGATLALLRERVATQFDLAREYVHVSLGDTDVAPLECDDDGPSEAHALDALQAAAQSLRARVLASAAARLDLPVAALTLRDGAVVGAGRSLALAELAAWSLTGQGLGALSVEAQAGRPSAAGRVAAATSVDVDLETGAVRVLGLALVADVGAWPTPEARARANGAVWRALGAALSEQQVFDPAGQPLVASLSALHPVRVGDVPTPLVTLMGSDDDGRLAPVADWDETCTGTVAAALAHAIADACRARPRQMPMGAEAILRALTPEDGLDAPSARP